MWQEKIEVQMVETAVEYVFIYGVILTFKIREDLSMEELECLTLQISNAHSRPFLVSTWYRPPQSPPDIFNSFEQLVGKIDAENSELYLLGDLNCNLLPRTSDHNSANLTNFILYFVLYRNNQIYKKGQSQRLKWLGQHNNNRGLLKEQTGLTNLQN